MIGRKLTIEQKDSINGKYFREDTFFSCVLDINNEWYINLSEEDQLFMSDEYLWVLALSTSEYIPPIAPLVP
jgi:hypothetical protein